MNTQDTPRLIEHAFPLKQASLDSVHEKNVRHGHISTLHIWPARRPLAACRAALIATLLPDPGTPEKRRELCEKIGGKVVKKIERKKMPNGEIVEREKEITEGGILHWGRETENKEDLEWFRQEIRKAYGGRAPKVLDPFAGGGAIPLEAMRLGCEATAADINPVAWFILKCTLEYPHKLAGKTYPLPEFILQNEDFMNAFYKAHPHLAGRTKHTKTQKEKFAEDLFMKDKADSGRAPKADLAWHVRAWGQWVLDRARRELARFYPTYADFEPLDLKNPKPYEKEPMRLVSLKDDGTPDLDALNAEFSKEYLTDKRNPRWVAKPTVAYLWARTVKCKNCRAILPLLKTRWLCKKDKKRVLLTMEVVKKEVRQMVGQASLPVRLPVNSVQAQRSVLPQGREAFSIYRRKLPHWRMEGTTYFLTWRLHQDQAELTQEERFLVVSALRHFEGSRYRLFAYVVMNDHVHVLVEPLHGNDLASITHSWKSFTAHRLQRQHGRRGAVWQDESFDRIMRDEAEFLEKAQYIQNNPYKRWPDIKEYSWVGFPQWEHVVTGAEACPTKACPTKACPTKACPTPEVTFGIERDVPVKGGNTAQRREHDKRIGAGTMSRSGAKCPSCPAIMTMEDIRLEGRAGRLEAIMTTVVVEGQEGKSYRLPLSAEIDSTQMAESQLTELFSAIPCGVPDEPLPLSRLQGNSGFRVILYGLNTWRKLFNPTQLRTLGIFVRCTREAAGAMKAAGYTDLWITPMVAYLALTVDRLADSGSSLAHWAMGGEFNVNTFQRFALPMSWDFAEVNFASGLTGSYQGALAWVSLVIEHTLNATESQPSPMVLNSSATCSYGQNTYDLVLTDPPYYDAIAYSDCMDFFYVWLRRTIAGVVSDLSSALERPHSPKWDHEKKDGELIDDDSRFGGDKTLSKAAYEEGMSRVFSICNIALREDGHMVIVFAHKHPNAWETLVGAIIRAGFVVTASWPIQTERLARTNAISSASLASSVWLVCKKRHVAARPGWDNQVLEEMRRNISEKLREFWDAGIRGPDFVWAATGPALEAYSKHPVVKKANEPGPMTVSEFLTHVRRMVVDFVVGRVLAGGKEEDAELAAADRLDEPTAYYLLHRHDFGMDEAPAGACILYAISCGISDKELASTWDLIGFTKGKTSDETEEEEADADAETDPDTEEDSGSKVKLKTWAQRKGRSLGYEAPHGKPVPLIDRVHCLMHLWKAGDLSKVDEYLDSNGLRRHELFKRLLQSLIELSPHGSDERPILESISNHVQARGAVDDREPRLAL